ncbi:hypothetical protein SLE2022_217350 [Rubroshorea leprosula]|uniref:DNA-directed RNA polymerase subunit n=1 Tax=Rubroshorea leprosula TaxID=152421 RepID=A0AAV5HMU1_9ROSI|nr:hypothetical protein SLEP1_g4167 [Rubroshorea leprosula]
MAYARARDFLFCEICGTTLYLVSTKHAECPLCKSRKNAKEILGKEISYRITTQDIKRELGIKLFDEETDTGKSGARMIKKACDKCGNPELEYTTRQMRSADEGQTVFYHCPKCNHQSQEN